jgi:ankyrin repeat protein
MNYKKIVKIVSLAVLAAALGQSAQAMEKSQEELNKALLKETEQGNIARVTQLLEQGADSNYKEARFGSTPLIFASMNGQFAIARLLLNHAADINCKDKENWTPLIWASWQDNLAIARLLLEYGADINCTDDSGWTPLIWASTRGHLAIVQLLLEHDADINCKDNYGKTALDLANQHKSAAIIAELLINEPQRREEKKAQQLLAPSLRLLMLPSNSSVLANASQQAESNPTLSLSMKQNGGNNLKLIAPICSLNRK